MRPSGAACYTISSMTTVDLRAFPGGEMIAQGLDDLAKGRETVDALLVSIGEPRLRRLGIEPSRTLPSAEHRLYELLASKTPASAHSRYNALVRRLVSFERAFACGR